MTVRFAFAVVAAMALIGTAGCGSDEGTSEVAPAPGDPDAEVSGTLRVFAYEDSVVPELIDPVTEANPDLEIKTATFDSNEEAAAKLAGGFEADVVEICLDEMQPLVNQDLLRPPRRRRRGRRAISNRAHRGRHAENSERRHTEPHQLPAHRHHCATTSAA